jgi:hypothetical protein
VAASAHPIASESAPDKAQRDAVFIIAMLPHQDGVDAC